MASRHGQRRCLCLGPKVLHVWSLRYEVAPCSVISWNGEAPKKHTVVQRQLAFAQDWCGCSSRCDGCFSWPRFQQCRGHEGCVEGSGQNSPRDVDDSLWCTLLKGGFNFRPRLLSCRGLCAGGRLYCCLLPPNTCPIESRMLLQMECKQSHPDSCRQAWYQLFATLVHFAF